MEVSVLQLGLDIIIDFFKLNIYVQDHFKNKKFRGKVGNSSNSNKLDEKKNCIFLHRKKKMLRISIYSHCSGNSISSSFGKLTDIIYCGVHFCQITTYNITCTPTKEISSELSQIESCNSLGKRLHN